MHERRELFSGGVTHVWKPVQNGAMQIVEDEP
jgi:hypothetical protein